MPVSDEVMFDRSTTQFKDQTVMQCRICHGRLCILKLTIIVGLVFATAYGILRMQSQPAPDHPFFSGENFQVIAHRGGRSLGPENTLYTFNRAAKL